MRRDLCPATLTANACSQMEDGVLLEGKVEECRAAFYAADTSGDGLLGAFNLNPNEAACCGRATGCSCVLLGRLQPQAAASAAVATCSPVKKLSSRWFAVGTRSASP